MKITKIVPKVVYGSNEFSNLENLIDTLYDLSSGYVVYVIDTVHQKTGLRSRLNARSNDMVFDADIADHEPTTKQVDAIRDEILNKKDKLPIVVVGIGGGSILDIAKATSVMLTNKGSSHEYQGWDIPKNEPIPKIMVPTLSGTGAEASRTAVLTGPERKLGINSDFSIANAVLMDPELLKTVDTQQEFFTGMDCFIHCVESLTGSYINEIGKAYAISAQNSTKDFFLKEKNYGQLMVASYFGGCSIANAGVGVCHALSYGLSLVLGFRHGIAVSTVFNQLDEFYGDGVKIFKEIVDKNNIKLPTNVCKNVTDEMMAKMVDVTYLLKKDLINALGENYKEILHPKKIEELFRKM